jgi:glycosyltransferase involved in cell wall biosynthesis
LVVAQSPPGSVVYSIVIPAFNEAASLPALIEDLGWLMARLDGPAEAIIVDDGSSDETLKILEAAQLGDPRIRPLSLSRNFGHQVALTAGLAHARGAAVVTMDADGQHPVATVLEMSQVWRAGYDVAYGVMTSRPSETAFKRYTSDTFYRVLNRVSDTPMPSNAGDFRLLDRRVVDAFLAMPERSRYLRGMFSWLGFRQTAVPYTCGPRVGGRTTYTVRRMVRFASDAMLSFSTWPLRVGLQIGFVVSALSILFGLVTIGMRLTSATVPGWATIVVVVSFLGGVQLTLLGVMGTYIGRIYDEVKGRPLFILREGEADRAVLRRSVDLEVGHPVPAERP